MNDFDLLTLPEVAEILHCSKAHVSNLAAGRLRGCTPLPVLALGRRKLVRRADLLDWIARNVTNATIPTSPERVRKGA